MPPLSKKQVSWWTSERVKLWISSRGGSEELPEGYLCVWGKVEEAPHVDLSIGDMTWGIRYMNRNSQTLYGQICRNGDGHLLPHRYRCIHSQETTRCNQC